MLAGSARTLAGPEKGHGQGQKGGLFAGEWARGIPGEQIT